MVNAIHGINITTEKGSNEKISRQLSLFLFHCKIQEMMMFYENCLIMVLLLDLVTNWFQF